MKLLTGCQYFSTLLTKLCISALLLLLLQPLLLPQLLLLLLRVPAAGHAEVRPEPHPKKKRLPLTPPKSLRTSKPHLANLHLPPRRMNCNACNSHCKQSLVSLFLLLSVSVVHSLLSPLSLLPNLSRPLALPPFSFSFSLSNSHVCALDSVWMRCTYESDRPWRSPCGP